MFYNILSECKQSKTIFTISLERDTRQYFHTIYLKKFENALQCTCTALCKEFINNIMQQYHKENKYNCNINMASSKVNILGQYIISNQRNFEKIKLKKSFAGINENHWCTSVDNTAQTIVDRCTKLEPANNDTSIQGNYLFSF